jgi:DNA invertase Pin-like site-specific DNA recombinase
MSNDKQEYSTRNQQDAIAAYAARRNMKIVRAYADDGRSGLIIGGRKALQELVLDVKQGRADFEFILVYDVSRWGRFQDTDESAYYEFICKKAGIKLCYCAEQFENDGSFISTIWKNIKRGMAGESSRELSVKVFIGQCRLAELGFWQGGPPPYGMRRFLFEEGRRLKFQLERGQQKSLQTDRVILGPGPPQEVAVVRRIFSSFVVGGKRPAEIANALNAEGILNAEGGRWRSAAIRDVLAREKYLGHNIFNRVSAKLKQKQIVNPPDMWIRGEHAFPALVDRDLFAQAQTIIANGRPVPSDQEILSGLTTLWREKGDLNRAIIEDAGMPLYLTYYKRFGGLIGAYDRIGFKPRRRFQLNRARPFLRAATEVVIQEIIGNIENLGGRAEFKKRPRLLTINDEFTVAIGTAWCWQSVAGEPRWRVHFAKRAASDLCLIICMDQSNSEVRGYYLLPTTELLQAKGLQLFLSNPVFSETHRHDTLEPFYRLCGREELRSAA